MGFDITKFSFKETFLNTNGKTSSTKLIGICSSLVCIILFITMIIFYMFNMPESGVILIMIDKIITFFGISAGLMGIKSITSSFGNNKVTIGDSNENKRPQRPQPGYYNDMCDSPEGDMSGYSPDAQSQQ